MTLAGWGVIGLVVAFAATIAAVLVLALGSFLLGRAERGRGDDPQGLEQTAKKLLTAGHVASIVTAAALVACCTILITCFLNGDNTIQYVVQYRSNSDSAWAPLFKVAGLWGGRSGSLLFWACLISLFNLVVALRNIKRRQRLDSVALAVSQVIVLAFLGVLIFSSLNMPFTPLSAEYIDANGQLQGVAKLWSMNALLEHWAMAIHPPTLFLGYSGLTIPFAYAIAALIINDPSKRWAEQSSRYALVSWLMLGIGIGLGAVWAYAVLGWGGYWGWDAVENASLLSWIMTVALVHSLTVYRQRGVFKRWAVMSACLAFAFVIVGTFISRSGIVQSVHAFDGDTVSLALFLAMIVVAVLAGIIGLLVRWKSFDPEGKGDSEVEHLLTKDAAYFFNNVAMVISALTITYLTLAPALPGFLPLGGQSVGPNVFNNIARPLSILFCLVVAVCPLLAWGKADGKKILKKAKLPALLALILFAGLLWYFFSTLVPSYDAVVFRSGSMAADLAESGPRIYYFIITVLGFLVASLLFFNSLFMIKRTASAYSKAHGANPVVGFFKSIFFAPSRFGGFLAHLSMAVILVGLIGSSMYVTEIKGSLQYDPSTDTASNVFKIRDFTLSYVSNNYRYSANNDDIDVVVNLAVTKDGKPLGTVSPSYTIVQSTQQKDVNAKTISFISGDLFIAFTGVDSSNNIVLDVRFNPLISFVWAGFGLLMVGTLIAAVGKRWPLRKKAAKE